MADQGAGVGHFPSYLISAIQTRELQHFPDCMEVLLLQVNHPALAGIVLASSAEDGAKGLVGHTLDVQQLKHRVVHRGSGSLRCHGGYAKQTMLGREISNQASIGRNVYLRNAKVGTSRRTLISKIVIDLNTESCGWDCHLDWEMN